ncbi:MULTISPECIES: alpha/beta fold hydrolase [Gordonia]|uniref:Alpha/beta hydrolase n=1 Tax=Gordonia amicalis TaxID=89053 RepID=A0AAE4RAS5_9ACTN|nr:MULTISPECIES: alpha/beta hydrolase [Gordonia]ATD72845.1 alpha/beta hydrolase [Gordonia sp. 1D]KAF0971034.1 putative aminoacrylate hydrolase RutD [Gordonia sp. YY1]MBA5846901.1 alpha/beta hydrolase [Gordonia amicalis]MCZ4579958.1 alpha/beta hydrolase [Gordonia amicalis]MDJ0451822.1 alpha/beta hydrolase [Gordonia amicalis]
MNTKSLKRVGGIAAAIGAAAVGVGVGTVLAGIARDALRAELAVDDGPDDLLTAPDSPPRRLPVRSSDGTLLNAEVYGVDDADDEGDVIVMVHGWTCNTAYWYPQINHLTSSEGGRRRVVVYDQRGHGLSERGRRRPTVAMLGQDLDAVLEATVPAGRRAILVGHSMGGMTIMSWADQYREKVGTRVSAVVLVSTAANAVMENHALVPVDLPAYARPFAPLVSKAITSVPVPIPKTSYGVRFSHYIALGPNARKAHVDFVDEMIGACPPRARAGWGSAMGKLDVTAGLAALSVPTTVVVGTEDRLTPRKHAEQMAEVLRRNGSLRELVVYEGVGHMSSIEAAERFNEMLDELVTEVSRTEQRVS